MLLSLLSGVLYAVSFCGFDQDYLAWFCLMPALWALDQEPQAGIGQSALTGWLVGFVAHLGVYTWLIGLLCDFGYLPMPVALLGYALICAVQSTLFALWGAGIHLLRQRGVGVLWAAPAMMVVAEWLTPALFPSYLGNSQYQRIVLIQACELWGVLGLSFAIVLVNSAGHRVLAWALSRGPFPAVGVGVTTAMLAGMLTFGFYTVGRLDETIARTEQSLTVGLVQTNMGIYEKTQHPEEGLRRHRDQSLEAEAAGAELIIWPESGYYYALSPAIQNVKREVLGRLRTPLLFGGMRVQPGPMGEELYNSAFLTDGEGTLRASYDKTHLLAFGEYLPGGELMPWMYGLSPQTSHFYRGKHVRPMPFRGMRLGVLICYEDILPQFVRHVMDEHPDILVNITNDAWFGQSNEPRIHLALATFRAIEQRRFLVRATNTGISAIVDPAGRILHETPVFARANLIGTVKPMYGLTAYQQLGDWPAYGSAALALGALLRPLFARLRRGAARKAS